MTEATWTERVWASLAHPHQPTRVEWVVDDGGRKHRRQIPNGLPEPELHRVGMHRSMTLLVAAHVMDDRGTDRFTSVDVSKVTGLSQSAAAKACAELVQLGWLSTETDTETRSLKIYEIIGA